MRRLFLVLALLGLGASLALGQELIPFQTIPPSTVGGCTPAGAPCPMGPVAPAGYHFDLQAFDNFAGETQVNLNIWENCDTSSFAACPYLNADGWNFQPVQASPGASCGSGPPQPCDSGIGSNTSFVPRFGVWEWSVRYPRGYDGTGSGYHIDTYINDNNSPDRVQYEEVGIGESDLGTSNNNVADYYCCTNGGNYDRLFHIPINSPTRWSDSFHTITTWWVDDGVANGEVRQFTDGSLLYSGAHIPSVWGSGGAMIIMESVSCYNSSQIFANGDPCGPNTATSGNPLTYKYFRFWKLVPN